jgi:hypothetical protein
MRDEQRKLLGLEKQRIEARPNGTSVGAWQQA